MRSLLCMALLLTAPLSYAEWSDNLRWSIDSSTRQIYDFETDRRFDLYAAGLDLHKVFATERRDVATLILQPYVLWMPADRPRPAFFDDNEATLTWRIANINVVVLPRGRLNLRVGHFEFPFGLEHDVNTNGTLRQYSNGTNLGGKADWGLSANGFISGWQYELALTRGSGQEYHRRGDPYVVSARIGSPVENDLAFGLAAFDGRVLGGAGTIERERVGADLRWTIGPVQLLAEASIGKDFDDTVHSHLVELNWTSRYESLLVYLQHRRQSSDGTAAYRRESNGVGVRWLLNNRFTIESQFDRRRGSGSQAADANELSLHLRYRTGEAVQ